MAIDTVTIELLNYRVTPGSERVWVRVLRTGKPLSFLDAHIRCGDALVGVTDLRVLAEGIPDEAFVPAIGDDPAAASAFKRINRAQRDSQPTLDLA